MPTCPAKLYRLTIHQHLIAIDLDLPEPYIPADAANLFTRLFQMNIQGIQMRMLGIPFQRSGYREIMVDPAGFHLLYRYRQIHVLAFRVSQGITNPRVPGDIERYLQRSIRIRIIQIRFYHQVGYIRLWEGIHRNIPEDSSDRVMRVTGRIRDIIQPVCHLQLYLIFLAGLNQ